AAGGRARGPALSHQQGRARQRQARRHPRSRGRRRQTPRGDRAYARRRRNHRGGARRRRTPDQGCGVGTPASGAPPNDAHAELTEAQAKAELKRLVAEIGAHDKRYYQEDAPTVSDATYDALRRRNEEIEARFPELMREDSPSRRVGAQPSQKFAKVRHGVAM